MDELLKAILLAAVSDKAMNDMEQPVILAFEKGQGVVGKATIKIKGTKFMCNGWLHHFTYKSNKYDTP